MTDLLTPFSFGHNPGPEIAAHLTEFLDALHTDEQTPERLLQLTQPLRKAITRSDPRQVVEIERACRDLFERIGMYEENLRKRILDAARDEIGQRDEGSADAIQWLDPLPGEEADALLVLDEKTGAELQRLVQQIRKAKAFIKQKIRPPTRLRWIGPPGVGKTTAAHWLASQVGKPLALVNVDQLVSSFVGKSGKNIRAVFDAAQKKHAILFLDEIDAIGVRRDVTTGGSGGEVEMRRVTTALLQILPSLPPEMVVICATNLPQLLDAALLSRLPLELRFDYPDPEARREMVRRVWASLDGQADHEALDWIVRRTEGRSGRYVTDLAHAAARHAITAEEVLTGGDGRPRVGEAERARMMRGKLVRDRDRWKRKALDRAPVRSADRRREIAARDEAVRKLLFAVDIEGLFPIPEDE